MKGFTYEKFHVITLMKLNSYLEGPINFAYYEQILMTTASIFISKHMVHVFIDIKLFNVILQI